MHVFRLIGLLLLGFGALLPHPPVALADDPPTAAEYVAHVGGDAQILPGNTLILDGVPMSCGKWPVVVDSKLDDYGAAYSKDRALAGFLIFNPRLLDKVSTPVKLWIFAHECGHLQRGPDEETADCFAVQKGRRARWLTPDGLEEVCQFISPAKGDSMHFSGSHRCELMRQCYADPAVR